MKKILRRISGKIVVEDVDTIEQTKGSIILEIKNALAQMSIKCELKEFEIEMGIPPIGMEIPTDIKINDDSFSWNLQGKFIFVRTKIFTTKFLKKQAMKKTK
jgi:hypothetical protein